GQRQDPEVSVGAPDELRKDQKVSISRDVLRKLNAGPDDDGGRALRRASRDPIDVRRTVPVAAEEDRLSVGGPDRVTLVAGVERDTDGESPLEIVGPDVGGS